MIKLTAIMKREQMNNLIRQRASLIRVSKLFAACVVTVATLAGCGGSVQQGPGQSTVQGITPPTISGTPPTSVTVGNAYSFTPTVTNSSSNPLTFSIASAPPWGTFNASTGKLAGTPSSANVGAYPNIVISVTDGTAQAALPAFSVVVKAATASTTTYTVTYDGNGATSGAPPTDPNSYAQGATVTVLGNTANLARSGYTFSGWNTAANGSGTAYAAGSTFSTGSANVTLYAQWASPGVPPTTYTLTYNGNGATSGAPPTDPNSYTQGATVTVLGNTANLARSGYTFSGWNTAANGSGMARGAGSTFSMGSANITLYAQWSQLATTRDPTTGVLPSYNDAYPNWAKAGLVSIGGIPARVDCTTAQAGVTLPLAPSGGDDASNIQTALNNCPTNTVIELGPGNFKISSQTANHDIWIHRSVTLRGAGTCNNSAPPYCQTVILASPGGATQGYLTGGSNCDSCAPFAAAPIYISPANFLNGTQYSWTGCSWGSNCDNNPSAYQLTSDGAQGSATIQLNRVNGLTVGGWVRIDENDGVTATLGPLGNSITAAADLLENAGAPATFRTVQADIVNGQEYGALLHRTTSELHLITAIGGACGTNCVTFDSPLTINYRVSHVAQIYTPNNAFITQVGVENLTIEGGVGGQTGGPLHMDFCAYCWLKNVETYYWVGGVGISNSARVQIDGSYFHDCSDCENNGNEYPLAVDGATTESLIENSIIRLAGKGMVGRACGGGNVIAYNYVDDTFYQASSIGNYWLDMGLNGSHYAGCHDTLFEGNWADNCDNDSTHGNDELHVYFRNWCTGLRSNFTDPSLANASSSTYNPADSLVSDLSGLSYAKGQAYPWTPGQRHAAGAMMADYWMAFVGNVLGEPGVTCATGCTMTGWVYSNAGAGEGQKDKSIWMTGWVGGGTADPYLTSASGTDTCNGSSPPGCTYFFRHGNYDTVTASIADYQTGYSKTLPNSFYLSSTPASFTSGAACTYPWPWVTPNGSAQIQTNSCGGSGLPAKARHDAGTPFKQP
jgi:uncharacterized repeat protein (TIGR02543 family)